MIVRLQGGMGNQLFQFAFGRSVALARNEELLFEKRGDMSSGGSRFPYSLDLFNTDVKFVRPGQSGPEYYEATAVTFDNGVYAAPKGTNFIGYWQTEKYFDHELVRKELSLRKGISESTQRLAEEISATPNSAFIHVRRTDYLTPEVAPWMGNLTMDYYTRAIAGIRDRLTDVTFFIFSDDPAWCRHNLSGQVIETNKPHEDLFLMSQCKHAVIANSSFSWWGAWFGGNYKGRLVIAPYRWFGNIQVVEYTWIR